MRTRPPNESTSDGCPSEECSGEEGSTGNDRWSWKVADQRANPDLGLRYEPGNWGDILKGTWAIIVARELARRTRQATPEDPVRFVDPFAGAPSYPLVETVATRLRWLRTGQFIEVQRPWLERGLIASTAKIIERTIEDEGAGVHASVFDLDDRRRGAWEGEDATILDVQNGADAIAGNDADLVLVDPYDFFDDWRALLPAVEEAARRSIVVVYLYNKSPRSSSQHRSYLQLRDRLREHPSAELLVGRIPSDAILPRAYHEMMLLAPTAFCDAVHRELSRSTRRLACKLSTTGAFEADQRGLSSDGSCGAGTR